MPHKEYVAWQQEVLRQCWRLLSETGAIYYNHKGRVQDGELQMPLELNPGLPLRQIITWRRPGGINFSPTFYLPTQEWIMILAKPAFRLRSKQHAEIGDVWNFGPERNNPHPAAFPLELPDRILRTAPARRVLDPFMGSGTTGVACLRHKVDFVGIEKSQRYYDLAKYRLERAEQQDYDSWTTLFDKSCTQVRQPGFQIETLFK